MRAVDIAGVMDIVGNKRGVMHILVHIGNQRVMDVVVDISGVIYILCNICCIVDIIVNIGGIVNENSVTNKNCIVR